MSRSGDPGHREPYPLKPGDIVSVRARLISTDVPGGLYAIRVDDSTDGNGLTEGPPLLLVPADKVRRSILILPEVPGAD